MTETDKKIREYEPPQDNTISIRRGGRFGITIETNQQYQSARESVSMLAVMLFVTAFGVFELSGSAAVIATVLGAFGAGVAVERIQTFYFSRERSSRDSETPE